MGTEVLIVLRILNAVAALVLIAPAQAGEAPTTSLEEYRWTARPLVVFADSDADPRVVRQLDMLKAGQDALDARDVVIIIDTDPAAKSEFRQTLRPHGFRFVLIDKDGKIVYRKPEPVPVRDLIRLIDRLPSRKDDIAAQRN